MRRTGQSRSELLLLCSTAVVMVACMTGTLGPARPGERAHAASRPGISVADRDRLPKPPSSVPPATRTERPRKPAGAPTSMERNR